jgi:preprotein translocase subunit YajC
MGGNPMVTLLLQIVAIGLVFYFLIIRPQATARKKAAEILAAIKKGDEVTTAGGIIGKVKQVKDTQLIIESGSAELVVDRGRIVRVGEVATPGMAG